MNYTLQPDKYTLMVAFNPNPLNVLHLSIEWLLCLCLCAHNKNQEGLRF